MTADNLNTNVTLDVLTSAEPKKVGVPPRIVGARVAAEAVRLVANGPRHPCNKVLRAKANLLAPQNVGPSCLHPMDPFQKLDPAFRLLLHRQHHHPPCHNNTFQV